MESKTKTTKSSSQIQRLDWQLPEAWAGAGAGTKKVKGVQKAQISGYNMS